MMRITNTILTAFLFLTFISCSKVNNKTMTVVKDCTGSYLRFHDKDYQVCNLEMVEAYDDGTQVEASFKKIDDCPSADQAVCEKLHINEGWVEVTRIK